MHPTHLKLKSPNWFCMNQNNVEPVGTNGLWVLKNFLVQSVYDSIKYEIRHVPAHWHNNYGNRHLSEDGNYPVLKELGARLIPHLNHLMQEDLALVTVRTYVDFSGSYFFPHFDGKDFATNVQIYMTDLDYPNLGTQFCTNPAVNSTAETLDNDVIRAHTYDEKDFFTVPFRTNWGYINDNRQRKIHKTLPIPLGAIRESVHFNYKIKSTPEGKGLELPWFNDEKWYDQFVTTVNQQYEQTHN